jgi:hypothetical protein
MRSWKNEVDDEVYAMIRDLDLEIVSNEQPFTGRLVKILREYE